MFTCQSPPELILREMLRRCDPCYRGPGCDVAQIEADNLQADIDLDRFEDGESRRRRDKPAVEFTA